MVKKGPKQPQRWNGQTLKVSEIREDYDAAVHGYTFFVTNPFSFVKLLTAGGEGKRRNEFAE